MILNKSYFFAILANFFWINSKLHETSPFIHCNKFKTDQWQYTLHNGMSESQKFRVSIETVALRSVHSIF